MAYDWLKDKRLLTEIRTKGANLINQLVSFLSRDTDIKAHFSIVGSASESRNMLLQNAEEPIDIDINLVIDDSPVWDDCKWIKNTVMKKFNEVLAKHGLPPCNDSTSALTTKKMRSSIDPLTLWSIDLGIICVNNDGSWYRLIHKKNSDNRKDVWVWEQARNSIGLEDSVAWIKANGYWNEVRECYKNKKNLYLKRNDHNHPSFICYIEAVNEIYNKH